MTMRAWLGAFAALAGRIGRAGADDRICARPPEALVACDERAYRGARAEAVGLLSKLDGAEHGRAHQSRRGARAATSAPPTDSSGGDQGARGRTPHCARAGASCSPRRIRTTRRSGSSRKRSSSIRSTRRRRSASPRSRPAEYEEKTRESAFAGHQRRPPDQALEAHLRRCALRSRIGAIDAGDEATRRSARAGRGP